MALSTLDQINQASGAAQKITVTRASLAFTLLASADSPAMHSYFGATGNPAGSTAVIGQVNTGAQANTFTPGAIPFRFPELVGATQYITKIQGLWTIGSSTAPYTSLMLYDMLWCWSSGGTTGWSTTSLVGQNTAPFPPSGITGVIPPQVSRGDLTGKDCQIWLETTTAAAAGAAATAGSTITYTDSGNISRTAVLMRHKMATAHPIGFIQKFVPSLTNTGVKSIQSLQLGVALPLAPVYRIMIVRPICEIPMSAPTSFSNVIVCAGRRSKNKSTSPSSGSFSYDGFDLGFPKIDGAACLSFAAHQAPGTTAVVPPLIYLTMDISEVA